MFIDEGCSYTNPVTSKKENWLGCRSGHAICIVCNSYLRELQSGAQDDFIHIFHTLKQSYLATGTGYKNDKVYWERIRKHNKTLGHTEALEAYCHRL